MVAVFQPTLELGDAERVLHTFDEDGQRYETRMIVVEDGEILWARSGPQSVRVYARGRFMIASLLTRSLDSVSSAWTRKDHV